MVTPVIVVVNVSPSTSAAVTVKFAAVSSVTTKSVAVTVGRSLTAVIVKFLTTVAFPPLPSTTLTVKVAAPLALAIGV